MMCQDVMVGGGVPVAHKKRESFLEWLDRNAATFQEAMKMSRLEFSEWYSNFDPVVYSDVVVAQERVIAHGRLKRDVAQGFLNLFSTARSFVELDTNRNTELDRVLRDIYVAGTMVYLEGAKQTTSFHDVPCTPETIEQYRKTEHEQRLFGHLFSLDGQINFPTYRQVLAHSEVKIQWAAAKGADAEEIGRLREAAAGLIATDARVGRANTITSADVEGLRKYYRLWENNPHIYYTVIEKDEPGEEELEEFSRTPWCQSFHRCIDHIGETWRVPPDAPVWADLHTMLREGVTGDQRKIPAEHFLTHSGNYLNAPENAALVLPKKPCYQSSFIGDEPAVKFWSDDSSIGVMGLAGYLVVDLGHTPGAPSNWESNCSLEVEFSFFVNGGRLMKITFGGSEVARFSDLKRPNAMAHYLWNDMNRAKKDEKNKAVANKSKRDLEEMLDQGVDLDEVPSEAIFLKNPEMAETGYGIHRLINEVKRARAAQMEE